MIAFCFLVSSVNWLSIPDSSVNSISLILASSPRAASDVNSLSFDFRDFLLFSGFVK
jgi:hypothetical protein